MTDSSDQDQNEWVDALEAADLPDGQAVEVVVDGTVVAVARVGEDYFAVDGICAHQGGPLGKGALCDRTLTCPWHGWQYDLPTGRQKLSETIRQRVYATRIVGDTIQILLNASGE